MSEKEPATLALIMKGGGAKGLAYVGALEVLQEKYKFTWFVGTSAGAIAAVLLGAGYSVADLKTELMDKDFRDFFDANWLMKPVNLVFYKGFNKAETFTSWLDELLSQKLNSGDQVMLSALKHRVTVYASTRDRSAVIFDPLQHDAFASYAARCSMSVPFVFTPQSEQGFNTFDGGMQNNFPVKRLLEDFPGTPFISLFLGAEIYKHERLWWPIELLNIATAATDREIVKQYSNQTVIIDTGPIGMMDFKLTPTEKKYLVACGRVGAWAHLNRDGPEHREAISTRDALRENVDQLRGRKKLFRKICAIALAALFLAPLFWHFWPRYSDIPFPEYMKTFVAIQDKSAELITFRASYVPRWVTWDGVVEKINPHEVYPSLSFAPSAGAQSVRATFDPDDFAEVAALEIGTRIRIQGRISDANRAGTYLERCTLIGRP